MRLKAAGADTGGTFTDVVAADGTVAKVLSDPSDPAAAVARGLSGLERPEVLAHGTTVATNTLLEGTGAVVALVTNRGLADVIEIARQDRPSLYDPFAERPPPLVPRELRFEVDVPPDLSSLPDLPPAVDAIAVCLLHADLDDTHERALEEAFATAGTAVSRSSAVSPEFREYERTVTTVVNAMLRPRCRDYLRALSGLADTVLVMTSAGGLLPAEEAADVPAALLLSGPAAGVRAAAAVAEAVGFPDAVSFDMGGTSTDVCLVQGGVPDPAPALTVGGYPVRMPSLDIHTIGAGGGSVAFLDPGGALRVGPRSAGAVPGPACYGRGGTEPTVTDADLLLGRIPSQSPLPELGRLDAGAAAAAFERLGASPEGVVQVVDAAMVQAVRRVSVERGVDPRALALVAFGGAGPLHACAVAAALGMPAVVVPPRAGVFSAVGLVTAPVQREVVRSWPTPGDLSGLAHALGAFGDDAETFLDCRYEGQSHEITVPSVEAFPQEHLRRNGFLREDAAVEVVALRARYRRPAPLAAADLPSVERAPTLSGPSVVAEPDCTVWVPEGWRGECHDTGAWVLTRER